MYNGRFLRIAAGDPGLFSSLGKLVGKALPLVKAIPGVGTVATIAGIAGSIGGKVLKMGGKVAGPAATGITIAGGLGTLGAGALAVKGVQTVGGMVGGMFGGRKRRYRRMNVTNPRALSRSIRRLKGFEKMVRGVYIAKRFREPSKSNAKFFRKRTKRAA